MSRWQDIVDAVKTRFGAIEALGVHEWLDRELADDELPALNLRDVRLRGDPATKDDRRSKFLLDFEADLITAEDGPTITAARASAVAVVEAIGEDETWKKDGEELAARTVLDEIAPAADKDGNWLGGMRVKFTVEFYLDRWSAD